MIEYYYQYKDTLYTNNKLLLNLGEYPIIKRTSRGVWIDYHGSRRFVLNGTRKKFACATKEEALESFRAKKRRQIRLLKYQLSRAEAALKLNPETNETQYFLDEIE